MGSHRRKWGWWLVAAIAAAVAASLFLHRKPAAPEASGEAGSADTASAVAVVRDTVYLTVDEETIPVVRERKVDTGKPRADVRGDTSGDVSGDVSGNAPVEAPVDAPAAAEETVVAVPVAVLNDLVRDKSGRDITLITQAPDRILLTQLFLQEFLRPVRFHAVRMDADAQGLSIWTILQDNWTFVLFLQENLVYFCI